MKIYKSILFAVTVMFCLKPSHSQDQANRGFGRISPGYQSFYYVRKQLPFYLVDNQGRNAAEILIYVKALPGQVVRHELQGTTQYDHDVPLHVIVHNLTQDCRVSVEWLDFDFREDGQASSRGLGTPPGANPNSSVPAGGSYTHIFRYKSVKTFKDGKTVLNEVLPALALDCHTDVNTETQASHGQSLAKQRNGNLTALSPADEVAKLLPGNLTVRGTERGSIIYKSIHIDHCVLVAEGTRLAYEFGLGNREPSRDFKDVLNLARIYLVG